MRYLLVYILLFLSAFSQAQQDAIYSQYLFNPFVINPAYAGSRDAVTTAFINRNQWVGIDGAPNTQTLSIHVPVNAKNLARGAILSHDGIGPTNNFLFNATGAYRVKMEQANLTFGLRAGIYNSVFDQGKLTFREELDALDTQERYASLVPTFDFGLYYFTNRFFAGLSMNHLTRHQFDYASTNNVNNYLRRHTFLSMGYVFDLKNDIRFKPSMLVKHAPGAGLNIDLNGHFLIYEHFWVGAGIRNLSSINLLCDINVKDYLRIGYAYDLNLTKLGQFSYGSHELFIGFDFNLKETKTLSPRYL